MKEKILIIEDDPMIQIQLKNLLTGRVHVHRYTM